MRMHVHASVGKYVVANCALIFFLFFSYLFFSFCSFSMSFLQFVETLFLSLTFFVLNITHAILHMIEFRYLFPIRELLPACG